METLLFIALICMILFMLPQTIAAGLIALAMLGFIIALVQLSISDLFKRIA